MPPTKDLRAIRDALVDMPNVEVPASTILSAVLLAEVDRLRFYSLRKKSVLAGGFAGTPTAALQVLPVGNLRVTVVLFADGSTRPLKL